MSANTGLDIKRILVTTCVCGLLAGGYLGCRPQPGKWTELAALRLSSGHRLRVSQEHYDWAEGWRVSFSVTRPDGEVYGSLLEMETFPWWNVRLREEGDAVKIWRGGDLVGVLRLSNSIFTNFLNSSFDTYTNCFEVKRSVN